MRATFPILVLGLLAACSQPTPEVANAATADQAPAVTAGSVGGIGERRGSAAGLPGGRAAQVPALQPMRFDEFEELNLLGAGCAFHEASDAQPLLLLRDQGDGVVKYRRALRRIAAPTPERAAIVAGGTASGDGVTFQIAHPPGDGARSGPSTVDWPATLTMRMTDGGERRYTGLWRCGS